MSIYPVKLSEWYPFGDEMHDVCYEITKIFRCQSCGSKLRFNRAIGDHSIPWGHGDYFARKK